MRNSNTALLVFSLSLQEELKNKAFFGQHNLGKSLSDNTKKIANQSGLPVLYFDEKQQSGVNFGERFSNALQDVFEAGYDKIITIGNDCPLLDVRHIQQAKKALDNNGNAIGPTTDGGFYLLGISKDDFDYHSFLDFSWNTALVYQEALDNIIYSNPSCTVLEELQDIDFLSDIYNISTRYILNEALRKSIHAIQKFASPFYSPSDLTTLQFLQQTPFNKGSPLPFLIQL
ncbi:DUF2064 domain-containing protein [Aquimarina spongiae]|uniref:DUF2064 domain-containing protein n=1 Tax=Aquimarina spongiae TaxID=570521 RepID=A0A1M6DTU8_9FLAO|nr:DUF2064 domain-containing protein [Aquimarina spongiae]SHI76676.1 hypothetical protein SAMN04488508_10315 [Aquimarina spongiae]